MKEVWLGYQVYYNCCDEFPEVIKAFDCKEKAIAWREDFKETQQEYRTIERMDVE